MPWKELFRLFPIDSLVMENYTKTFENYITTIQWKPNNDSSSVFSLLRKINNAKFSAEADNNHHNPHHQPKSRWNRARCSVHISKLYSGKLPIIRTNWEHVYIWSWDNIRLIFYLSWIYGIINIADDEAARTAAHAH